MVYEDGRKQWVPFERLFDMAAMGRTVGYGCPPWSEKK